MSTEHVSHTGEGSVVALWRYPVKSMLGEELNASAVTQRGLLGDRADAPLDTPGRGVLAGHGGPRLPGHGHRLRAAGRDLLRLCRRARVDHGHPRPAAGVVSTGAVRGAALSAQHRGTDGWGP